MDAALAAFDYARAREEQARARSAGRLMGIGIASYVEITGAGSSTYAGRGMADIPGTDTARVWLGDDGLVHLQTSCPAIGQGAETTFPQVAAAASRSNRMASSSSGPTQERSAMEPGPS